MFRAHFRPVVLTGILLASGSAALGQRADDAAYRAATGLLHRGLYDLAATEYANYLRDHAAGAQATSARYGLAVCLTRLGKWEHAAAELDQIARAESFEFAPDAMLLRAQCAVALKDDAAAAEGLRSLLDRHPNYEHADSAAGMLGEALYRLGRPEDSARVLGRLIQEQPQSAGRARAEFVMALCESARGKDDLAAERLVALQKMTLEPELAASAMLAEAQCRHRLGQAEAAHTLYQRASKAGSDEVLPEALLGVAQLTRAAGKAHEAGPILDDLLKRFEKSGVIPAARLERARVDLDLGKPERALPVLERLASEAKGTLAAEAAYWAAKCELRLSRFDQAAERLGAAARAFPQSALLPEMIYDRGVALQRAGDADGARAAYAEVVAKFADHALAPEATAAEAGLAQGAGDYAACEVLCARFADRHGAHPKAASVELMRAENDVLAGRLEQAGQRLAEFLHRHPEDPQAVQASIRRGLVLARLGKTDDAAGVLAPALQKAERVDPALVRSARAVLADHALAGSDWAGAERELRAVTGAPEGRSADAVLKLGLSILRQGRADEALTLFDQVCSEFPKDPAAVQAAFERGQVLVDKGKLDEAKASFERVLAAEDGAEEARFTGYTLRHLASIASRQNRPGDAAALLDKVATAPGAEAIAGDALYEQGAALLAAGKYEEAGAAFERLIATAPRHVRAADARAQRGIAASRQGEYAQAVGHFEEATESAPGMRAEVRSAMEYEHAWALRELGKKDESRGAYERLLSHPLPPSLEAHGALDLAQILIGADEHAKARELLTRAQTAAGTAGEPDGPPVAERALYLQAVCDLKAEKPAEAGKALDQFLERYSRSELAAAAGLLNGQARLKSGRHESAAEQLRRVVDASPPDATLAPALLCLGEASAGAHQWARSQEAFEQYLRRFPEGESRPQAQFGIGWAIENQGRHAEAIGAYREVVANHEGPTAARSQFQIGECLFALKRYEEAATELLKVDILYAYPEWTAGALYEAGRCLTLLGKRDDAAKQFTQVVERFKDTEWARLASQRLAEAAPATLPGAPAAPPAPRTR